tara:strand:- start:10230 stop:11414 length:1185 start_codon:yes stop_codon:yes gene_type:complete
VNNFISNKYKRKLLNLSFHNNDGEKLQNGKIRIDDKFLYNFCSNDYLGLSKSKELIENSIDWANKFGTGLSSSRMVSGNLDLISEIENKISVLKLKETSVIMGSGFQCNLTVIPAITNNSLGQRQKMIILSDKLNHSSIHHGCLLTQQKTLRYKHLDYCHLESLLKKNINSKKIIISETIFSMDGDIADISTLRFLAKKYNSLLYFDEAHATGIFGKNGFGLTTLNNSEANENEVVIGTFSKAFGSYGSYISCSQQMKERIINSCSGLIYSTVLPPPVLGSIQKAIELIPNMKYTRKTLLKNSEFLRRKLKENGFNIFKSKSHIIPVVFSKTSKCTKLSEMLKENGFYIHPVKHPTVPIGQSRLRISLTSFLKKQTIIDFIKKLRLLEEIYEKN